MIIASNNITDVLTGANSFWGDVNGNGDFYVVFEWTDGDPLPFGENFFGVSWGGWSQTTSIDLEIQVNLSTDQEEAIVHWFNDGWNYTSHDTLSGHLLTVTQYNGGGFEITMVWTTLRNSLSVALS